MNGGRDGRPVAACEPIVLGVSEHQQGRAESTPLRKPSFRRDCSTASIELLDTMGSRAAKDVWPPGPATSGGGTRFAVSHSRPAKRQVRGIRFDAEGRAMPKRFAHRRATGGPSFRAVQTIESGGAGIIELCHSGRRRGVRQPSPPRWRATAAAETAGRSCGWLQNEPARLSIREPQVLGHDPRPSRRSAVSRSTSTS